MTRKNVKYSTPYSMLSWQRSSAISRTRTGYFFVNSVNGFGKNSFWKFVSSEIQHENRPWAPFRCHSQVPDTWLLHCTALLYRRYQMSSKFCALFNVPPLDCNVAICVLPSLSSGAVFRWRVKAMHWRCSLAGIVPAGRSNKLHSSPVSHWFLRLPQNPIASQHFPQHRWYFVWGYILVTFAVHRTF